MAMDNAVFTFLFMNWFETKTKEDGKDIFEIFNTRKVVDTFLLMG